MNLFDLVETVAQGRWFKDPSPFRVTFEKKHPVISVVTGPNASGKSLLRKVLSAICNDQKTEYIALSQCGRREGGIMNALIYGNDEDESTGTNTVDTFLKMIGTVQRRSHPVVVFLDEPEIGCSEEIQVALGERIVRDMDTMPNLVAMFVVTHSRQLVRPLLQIDPSHIRMDDDMTLREWVDRPVASFGELELLKALANKRWGIVSKMRQQK